MFCSNCGSTLKENARFCPNCGKSLKRGGFSLLKNILIAAGLLAALFFLLGYFYKGDLDETVKGQLSALKSNKLTEAYYGYTSKDFQETNSFEKFKEFIRSFPLLQSFKRMTLGRPSVKDDLADIKVVLESNEEVDGEISYKLIKEDNKWKIIGIQITEFQKPGSEEQSTATAALIAPVELQLKALQENNLLEAYKNNTTKEFQKQIPFEDFKTYALKYPILTKQKHYDFKEHYTSDDKGVVTVVLNPEDEAIPIRYILVKEDGTWKIQLMRIGETIKNTKDAAGMLSVVREQLDLIKKNQVDHSYHLISQQLQKETSLENYIKFIAAYPAFTNYTVVNINEPYVEEGIGRVTAELKNDDGTTVIEYALTKENDTWKILGMHIEKHPETSNMAQDGDIKNFKTRDLINVIQSFLASIREFNLKKAYTYTSTQFQQENDFAAFEEFIKKHPEFAKSTTSSFEKLIFNNSIATFSGEIIHSDHISLPVEFDLIREEGIWKILHIYVLPAKDTEKKGNAATEQTSTLEFSKAVFGTKINDQGIVENPTTVFKKDTGDIFINIYLTQAKQGEHVNVVLKHVESGSSIPKIEASVEGNGDTVLTLTFSPPAKGWPAGNYQLRAASENNKSFKTYTFKVE